MPEKSAIRSFEITGTSRTLSPSLSESVFKPVSDWPGDNDLIFD